MDKIKDLSQNYRLKQVFQQNGIVFAAVFGSVARGTDNEKSDYDILVEFGPDKKVPLTKFMKVEDEVANILQSPIDLLTIHSLGRKSFKTDVLKTMKVIYGQRKEYEEKIDNIIK